jgi:hypothetical protein
VLSRDPNDVQAPSTFIEPAPAAIHDEPLSDEASNRLLYFLQRRTPYGIQDILDGPRHVTAVADLTFLWRPTIGFGACAAHQHRSLTVAQAVSLEEGRDGLLVVDDHIRACPVRAPQAAVETPGIEHAGERIPDVRERIRFP